MRRRSPLLAILSVVVLVSQGACDRSGQRGLPLPRPSPVVTPTPSPPAPPPAPARAITVGEEVTGTFTGASHAFELTAPASGTLVAQLTWDPWRTGSLLVLRLDDRRVLGSPPDWSPIVGRLSVAGERRYAIVVEEGGTDWYFDDPFVLKTWIE